MSTVHLLRGVVSGDVPAALVALVAYRPLPAVGLGQVVAAVVCEVPDHELAVLVLGHDSCDSLYDSLMTAYQVAEEVLGLGVLLEAVPVAPAVEGVRVPARAELRAVDLLVPRI